jgi:hypothetical protein
MACFGAHVLALHEELMWALQLTCHTAQHAAFEHRQCCRAREQEARLVGLLAQQALQLLDALLLDVPVLGLQRRVLLLRVMLEMSGGT